MDRMKHYISILSITALMLMSAKINMAYADNPIVPYIGMADPHIFIFNNNAYLYATRDADSTAQNFIMPDWHIWSSDDLIHWTHERTIKPTETYMGESTSCWATDVAHKNGDYFFYFSNGNINTGVMKASSPTGPFVDALGKPLLNETLTVGKEYDPTLLVDDDPNKTAYIVFGHYRNEDPNLNYYIAKLGDDMTSLAETPKAINIIGENNVLMANDKPNLHKQNGLYYLSAGSHYATATNVYGPYTRKGNSGNNAFGLTSRAHGNYFEWNNQWFHTWCHFHMTKEVARYRESYITYLHYKDNGEMVDDVQFLEKHFSTGVGQYDASWDKIEAEWYMAASNIVKNINPKGSFEIQNIKNGDFLYFPNVKNIDKSSSMTFNLSALNGGIIEVRSQSEKGRVLGSVTIPKAEGCKTYNTFDCKLKHNKGVKDIYLTFKGNNEDMFKLDWFKFN